MTHNVDGEGRVVDGGGRVGGSEAHNADGEGRVVGEGRQLRDIRLRGEEGSAVCTVCRRSIALTRAGQVRVHEPVGNRCLVSRSFPTVAAVPRPSLATSSDVRFPAHESKPVFHQFSVPSTCSLVADSSACCSLCLRCMSLTSAGVMRVHGPVGRRCPGSGKPPRGFSGQRTSVPSGEADQHQGVTPPSRPSVVSLSQGEPAAVQHLPIVRVLRRIPKAAREQCSSKLTSILEEVERSNDVCSWNRLFQFSTSCLRLPHRGNPHQSLASKIKDQLREEAPPLVYGYPSLSKRKKPGDPLEGLARQVSRKIEDGDVRGAIRLASSEDTLADFSDNTFTALQAKHPLPHPDCSIPPVPLVSSGCLEVTAGAVVRAIKSFPNSSAGGFDRLRPQHLKDLLTIVGDVEDSPLISALIAFCTLVLEGRTPEEVRPFFFGASLVALQKKSGGVRPIAVGCTLRRLVAKVAGFMVVEDMAALLAPRQLGYGVKGGAEAAVHAARKFLSNMDPDCAFVKLDFRNAFNCIRRDCMLQAVCDLAPTIYPFVHSLYSAPSLLRRVILWDLYFFA